MAGHSKWHNIQHRKNKQDALRGKLFSKLIRDLTTAARAGGADPAANALLRTAIDKAKTANMTNDTIQRAIQRGAGGADGQDFFPVRYEGYAPGGIAVVVSCETDNRNRTVASVRHAFSKCGGNLGTDGSVAYLFDEVGLLQFSDIDDTDALFEAAVEAGADDVRVSDDGIIDVVTASTRLAIVRDALEAHGYIADEAELTLLPQTLVDCDDETAQALGRLLDMLDAIDDVQRVCHNAA